MVTINLKLACFDLDGTLFKTDLVNYYAYQKALKEYNFKLDKQYFTNYCNGRHYLEFLPIITNNIDKNIIEKIHQNKKLYYQEFLNKAIVNEHLFTIIKALRLINCKIVIVTTASKQNTIDILKYFNKLELFDDIISAEDYQKKKPDSEAYILAMQKFKAQKEETIIFEDSEVGLQAGKNTGASVYKIENF